MGGGGWVVLGLKTSRALVPQGRALIGGASVELLRVVVVVVVVPQSKIEIEFELLQDPRSSKRLHFAVDHSASERKYLGDSTPEVNRDAARALSQPGSF